MCVVSIKPNDAKCTSYLQSGRLGYSLNCLGFDEEASVSLLSAMNSRRRNVSESPQTIRRCSSRLKEIDELLLEIPIDLVIEIFSRLPLTWRMTECGIQHSCVLGTPNASMKTLKNMNGPTIFTNYLLDGMMYLERRSYTLLE
ncbi:hypothetical protein YC2023_065025 [Brassica napus]